MAYYDTYAPGDKRGTQLGTNIQNARRRYVSGYDTEAERLMYLRKLEAETAMEDKNGRKFGSRIRKQGLRPGSTGGIDVGGGPTIETYEDGTSVPQEQMIRGRNSTGYFANPDGSENLGGIAGGKAGYYRAPVGGEGNAPVGTPKPQGYYTTINNDPNQFAGPADDPRAGKYYDYASGNWQYGGSAAYDKDVYVPAQEEVLNAAADREMNKMVTDLSMRARLGRNENAAQAQEKLTLEEAQHQQKMSEIEKLHNLPTDYIKNSQWLMNLTPEERDKAESVDLVGKRGQQVYTDLLKQIATPAGVEALNEINAKLEKEGNELITAADWALQGYRTWVNELAPKAEQKPSVGDSSGKAPKGATKGRRGPNGVEYLMNGRWVPASDTLPGGQ